MHVRPCVPECRKNKHSPAGVSGGSSSQGKSKKSACACLPSTENAMNSLTLRGVTLHSSQAGNTALTGVDGTAKRKLPSSGPRPHLGWASSSFPQVVSRLSVSEHPVMELSTVQHLPGCHRVLHWPQDLCTPPLAAAP